VGFRASTRELYAANLGLRTATRVLVRVTSFPARTFADLEREAGRLPWEEWLPAGRTTELRVTSHSSRLYHTGAIAERLARASGDLTRTGGGGQLVVVRVMRDQVTISLDSSGEPLHRRGWRVETAKAPLRETLAAAMILAAGWDPATPLVDPFCGSGTIPIEAATMAAGLAPGRARPFAFQHWPGFEPGTWASVTEEVRRTASVHPGPVIAGADRDAGAVDAAGRNAARAEVDDRVSFRRAAISDLEPTVDGPGWLITNPPHGRRVGGPDLRNLHARLGEVVRTRLRGWSVGLLVADPVLAAQAGLGLTERFRTVNGGIPVHFLTGPVEPG
jgi:putative N6-adenine-specific DNA methylase